MTNGSLMLAMTCRHAPIPRRVRIRGSSYPRRVAAVLASVSIDPGKPFEALYPGLGVPLRRFAAH